MLTDVRTNSLKACIISVSVGHISCPPEVVSLLPTKMRRLHDRYMLLMSQCVFRSGAKIKDDDFFRGEAIIWINWEEVYQLYYQDALDISMVDLWLV